MLDRMFEFICALLMASVVLITMATIVFRYIMQSSLPWSYEVLLGLMVYLTFFSGYVALRQGAHLRIDVVVGRLSLRAQMAVYLVNQLMVIGVSLVMVIWGTEQTVNYLDRSSLMLNIPQPVFYAVIPLAGAAMIIECLRQCMEAIREFRQGRAPYSSKHQEGGPV